MVEIIKKDNTIEQFNFLKIVTAVKKSAERVNVDIDIDFQRNLKEIVLKKLEHISMIKVSALHEIVQESLLEINNDVYKEYKSYRDYKKRLAKAFEDVMIQSKRIVYTGDKENANKNSLLVSTKKGLVVNELAQKLMLEYELPKDLAKAHIDKNIYIHDMGDRFFNGINCCLCDMASILEDGFELNGVKYTEPTSCESFMRVFSDLILEASSQQYGGFTVPEIDTVGAKYVDKALKESEQYYREELGDSVPESTIKRLAKKYVIRALDQGFQAVETRLNTISNSNTRFGCLW